MSRTLTALGSKTVAGMPALSVGKKLLLLLGNTLSLLGCAGVGALLWVLRDRPGWCAAAVALAIYLLPALACRLLLFVLPIRRQEIAPGSRDFFVWWFALNLQVIYSRLPFLEELLRIVPGLYSLWLRLWGARIGRLTYWGAGLQVLDRSFLRIGDDVTFGAGVHINPHVMLPSTGGPTMLVLAPVTIGDRVSVGGYSLLVAGTEIGPDQTTRAFLILPPFSRIENGRRIKPAGPPGAAQEDTHDDDL